MQGKSPTPKQVREARESLDLSRDEAAEIVYKSVRSWEKYETGERVMDPAVWELWQMKAAKLSARLTDTSPRYAANLDSSFACVEKVEFGKSDWFDAYPTFAEAKREVVQYLRSQRDAYDAALKLVRQAKE